MTPPVSVSVVTRSQSRPVIGPPPAGAITPVTSVPENGPPRALGVIEVTPTGTRSIVVLTAPVPDTVYS